MAAPEVEPEGSPRAVGVGWFDNFGFTSKAVGNDNVFGIQFGEFVEYLPTRVGPHSHIDMVAFFEAYRSRCVCCDFKFLEMLMKPVSDVACVKAKLYLPNNCESGTECQKRFNASGRKTPGYQLLLSSCNVIHAYEKDRQEFKLVEVFIPVRIDKYMHEFMFTKAGRREMQMCPQTACMTRDISYTEPKLRKAFTEDQQILYERAILMWMPTFLMSECLSNKVLEDAEDRLLNRYSRAWRDFWYGREKVTGATHWQPHAESVKVKGKKDEKKKGQDENSVAGSGKESAAEEAVLDALTRSEAQEEVEPTDSEEADRLTGLTGYIRDALSRGQVEEIDNVIVDIFTGKTDEKVEYFPAPFGNGVDTAPILGEAQRRKIARDRAKNTSRSIPTPPTRVEDTEARARAPQVKPRRLPQPPKPLLPATVALLNYADGLTETRPAGAYVNGVSQFDAVEHSLQEYGYWWCLPSTVTNYVYLREEVAESIDSTTSTPRYIPDSFFVEMNQDLEENYIDKVPQTADLEVEQDHQNRFAKKRALRRLIELLYTKFEEYEEDRSAEALEIVSTLCEEIRKLGGADLKKFKFIEFVVEQHGIKDKITKERIRATLDHEKAMEREDAGGIAGIAPAPCGKPEDWQNTHPSVLKGEPKKGENRSGTVKFESAREKIMKKNIRKVRAALKRNKIEVIPNWFQAYIDEFESPDRVPDYILMQMREQVEEKIDRASGNDGVPRKSAVIIGPMNEELNVGSTRATHIVDSANARMMGEGSRVVTATDEMVDHTMKTAKKVANVEIPVKELRQLWIEHGGFEDAAFKPGSWEEKKYFDEIGSWKEGGNLKHMELFVKFCQTKKGKTQRLISNENGMRQVSRNFLAKLAEMLEGKAHTAHNTKHKTKAAVNALLFKNTNKNWGVGKPGVFVEGDGRAWDSSCGRHVRWGIEQVVEQHILEALGDLLHGLGKEDLDHRYNRCYGDDPMQWKYGEHASYFNAIFMITTDFIMRSTGDAMTSFLNRFVNMVLWTNALTNEINVVRSFGRPVVPYKCRWSGKGQNGRPIIRQFYFIYEGDDSGLKLERELLKYRHKIENFWKQWGFNMEIKWIWDSDPMIVQPAGCACDLATFCGWKYVVSQGAITRTCAPDLSRAMGAEISTSQCANQSCAGRDTVGLAYGEARAIQFLDNFAGLSKTYTRQAEAYGESLQWYKKKPKMDTKLKISMAYIATGQAYQFDGEYLEAMETSFQYTHVHELRLLRLHQGVTDWDFYYWEGAAQSTHRTSPDEAFALGRGIGRPRVHDPQINEARRPKLVLGEDEPYPADPRVPATDGGHTPRKFGSEFSSDCEGDGPGTTKKKIGMQLLPAEIKEKVSAFLKPAPREPSPDDWGPDYSLPQPGNPFFDGVADRAEIVDLAEGDDIGVVARMLPMERAERRSNIVLARLGQILQDRTIEDGDFDDGIGLRSIRQLEGAARMRAWHEANAGWMLEWGRTGINRRAHEVRERAVQRAVNRELTLGPNGARAVDFPPRANGAYRVTDFEAHAGFESVD